MDGLVLCIGGLVLDRRVRSCGPVVPATSNPATVDLERGGVAANVACGLARRGVPAALVSCVGEDDAGRLLIDRAAAAGVDVGGVRVVPGAASAQYVAMLQPDGELYVAAAVMDVLDEVTPDDVRRVWPGGPDGRAFAETNLSAEVLAQVIRLARESGAQLAVDGVSVPKAARLPRELGGIAVLFANLDEAHALAGAGDAEACARELVARGAEAVVVTLGAGGALVVEGDRDAVHVPGVPVRVRDVTGAGDALVAATLAAAWSGTGPETGLPGAVRAGVAAAAEAIA